MNVSRQRSRSAGVPPEAKKRRQAKVTRAWRDLIVALGYDLKDPHLQDSPARVARFLAEWHTNEQPRPAKLTTFPNRGYDQMVVVGGIRFYSMCAHHGAVFSGVAAVGYVPGARIVGLSKLARIVDHYARRFQTQEDLTKEIADCVEVSLAPQGVGVLLHAEHQCMSMRGIKSPGHWTVTSDLRGVIRKEHDARAEFLSLAKTNFSRS